MSFSISELSEPTESQSKSQSPSQSTTTAPSAATSDAGTFSIRDLAGEEMTATQPHVGPAGQPNPNNIYQATPEESTPEGAAAALTRRQAAHPIISGIGQGAEGLLQPVFHPIDTVENIAKQTLPPYQLYDRTKKAYALIQQYEKARSQGKTFWQSMAEVNDYAGKQDAAHQAVEQAIADYKKNPTQTTAKILTQVAGNVALLAAGGRGATMEAEAPATVARAEAPVAEAAAESQPGIVKQILQGKKVVQPPTQTAVRSAVELSAENAGVELPDAENLRNLVEQHVDNLKTAKTQAYQQADEVAGKALGQEKFDLKAEKLALSNDKYKLSQLGNTDADLAQKGKLVESINDATDRISKAEQAMKDAGVDPKAADVLNTRWQRGQQFQQLVTKATNADGTVDVDKLSSGVRNMRAMKVKGRVVDGAAQLFGEDGAERLESQLQEMSKLGAHAVRARWVAGIIGFEIAKHLLGAAGGKAVQTATEFLP